ncbi:MAG: AfsR/SARP family transcriptional regulator, partial [Thermomicrobiales bacterium]
MALPHERTAMRRAGRSPLAVRDGAPILCIRLLGEFDLRRGEDSLPPVESARAESLLAYLLLHQDAPQSRQHLAFLLWPDSTEPQARTNLRHVLHTLRRALPDADQFLEVTPRTLRWRMDEPFWLDVAAFADAASSAEREAADGGLAALREAVELYTGDLLAGRYDEWLLGERQRLRQRFLDALERLAALLEAGGDHAQALRYAERLLRHDSLREETYRLLMRLHDARGDRARALHVYHVCAATLERELGVEPSARTQETYEELLSLAGEPADVGRQAGRIGGPPAGWEGARSGAPDGPQARGRGRPGP